jgi:hypothetical protein
MGAMDGIDVAHDKDRQRALVNAVMSLRGEFLDNLRTV